jgi:hypothetical protein
MYMIIVGDGEAITAGTTLTLLGDGTILTTIRGDGDGTTLGDITVGAGVETLAGVGPETGVGDTHTTVGAGPVIMDGAAIMAAIGTVHTIIEGIMEEIMLTCPVEEVMLRVFQEPLYHQEQMPIQVGSEIIAVVPIEQ